VPDRYEPTVIVAVPALDEAASIEGLLDSLAAQTYPLDRLEVVIADGGSTDGTRELVAAWADSHSLAVRLVDNPDRVPAGGFNRAIATSEADVVVIFGAHAQATPEFVERSVHALVSSGADCAGGVIETIARTSKGEVVAAVTTSKFGVGNALFRTGASSARLVDTVAFGAYWRPMFDRIGLFDVSLVGAEDDELNFRVVQSGGRIWFDPTITSRYFCRDDLRGLARQYHGYGHGKALLLRRHRRAPSLRMLAPGGLVVGLTLAAVTSVARRSWWPLLAVVAPYGLVVTIGAREAARRRDLTAVRVAPAFPVLHLSYGLGFVRGLLKH
jgi:glycosyltransferase involved in cell wall biosynthesis